MTNRNCHDALRFVRLVLVSPGYDLIDVMVWSGGLDVMMMTVLCYVGGLILKLVQRG